MIPGRVSIVIPSRNERYLTKTVAGLLSAARGDVEILVMLDGGVPEVEPLPDDPRVRIFRRRVDPTHEAGMRFCINEGAEAATGEYLLKCDAHCIFAPGYDLTLKADCDDDWLVVPTRHSVDPKTWTVVGPAGSRVNYATGGYRYHYLTFPFALSMYGYGLHAKTLSLVENTALNVERQDRMIDDLMSFQGSCWFQKTAYFRRLGPLDHANYYFYQEAQETGLRVWMTGGRCVVNKWTWYAHLHKGKEEGRGFYLSLNRKRRSEQYATDFWTGDKWPGATVTFEQFLLKFDWLTQRLTGADRWPDDWRDFATHRRAFESRPPDQIPPHT